MFTMYAACAATLCVCEHFITSSTSYTAIVLVSSTSLHPKTTVKTRLLNFVVMSCGCLRLWLSLLVCAIAHGTLQAVDPAHFTAAVYEHRPRLLGLLRLTRQLIERGLDDYESALTTAVDQVEFMQN